LVIGGSAFFQFFSHEHFWFANAVIGTISSHPSFHHQFASMRAIIIPPPSIATIMPMSCPQQKPVLGIRRITSIVWLLCAVVMWNIGTLSQLVVPHPQICGLSAFLRASSEPIAIVKAHPPQLPFRKVALFGTATIAHERLLFPATWIQPLDSTSSYKSTLPI
jgi:hypothetical protein